MLSQFERPMGYGAFLKHLIPSILTMIFLSFYTTIDGFFVSNYAGSNALAGINIAIPITCIIFGSSIMLATGAGAILGERMGRGHHQQANQLFTLSSLALLVFSLVVTGLGLLFLEPIIVFLGASPQLLPHAMPYAGVVFAGAVPMSFKLFFEYLVRTDGNPKVALWMSSSGLILNVVLDYLFVGVAELGTLGAALGTLTSITLSAGIGLVYFLRRSHLRFVRPHWEPRALIQSCVNGSSEMLTELSTGITTFLFNILVFRYHGEDGIAAITILMYLFYFFLAFYMGITVAVAPIVSYHLGSGNLKRIQQMVAYSLRTLAACSLVVVTICYTLGPAIIGLFTPEESSVFSITWSGLQIFGVLFLFAGWNVFFSGYFTALGNGILSAVISFLRSLVLVVAFLMVLPPVLEVNGLWAAIPCAELGTLFVAAPLYLIFGQIWRKPVH